MKQAFVIDEKHSLNSFQQWTLPDDSTLVITEDETIPETASQLGDAESIVAKAAEAEAAFARFAFGSYELDFSEIYDHAELDVRSDDPIEANGVEIQEDGAEYRQTSSSEWVEKFDVTLPEIYEGRSLVAFEYRGGEDSVAHVQVTINDEEVESLHTESSEYVAESIALPESAPDTSDRLSLQLRATASSPVAETPSARVRKMRMIPEFDHADESFWLSDIERRPISTDEFAERVGL